MINTSKRLLFKTRSQIIVSKPFRNFAAKIFNTAEEAIADIPHGASIGFGGFGMVGLLRKFHSSLPNNSSIFFKSSYKIK